MQQQRGEEEEDDDEAGRGRGGGLHSSPHLWYGATLRALLHWLALLSPRRSALLAGGQEDAARAAGVKQCQRGKGGKEGGNGVPVDLLRRGVDGR